MSIKKNVPSVATSLGKPCPVCGRTSYSLGGTHPQCSFLRADQKLLAMRRKRKAR
jgi:hypothetical protein